MSRRRECRGVSALTIRGVSQGDTNEECHDYTGGVKPHERHILAFPRLFIIFWGRYYIDHHDAVTLGMELVNELIGGPFVDGLSQYGINKGSFLGFHVFDSDAANPAPPT